MSKLKHYEVKFEDGSQRLGTGLNIIHAMCLAVAAANFEAAHIAQAEGRPIPNRLSTNRVTSVRQLSAAAKTAA